MSGKQLGFTDFEQSSVKRAKGSLNDNLALISGL